MANSLNTMTTLLYLKTELLKTKYVVLFGIEYESRRKEKNASFPNWQFIKLYAM